MNTFLSARELTTLNYTFYSVYLFIIYYKTSNVMNNVDATVLVHFLIYMIQFRNGLINISPYT